MFDRKSYLDTISALRADPDKLEEIIKMKENDRRHIPHSLRPVAAVAAALALLGISVGAVNTEPVQEFLYHISTAVQVGVFRQDITTEEGVDLTIYHMPEVSLEDRGDHHYPGDPPGPGGGPGRPGDPPSGRGGDGHHRRPGPGWALHLSAAE